MWLYCFKHNFNVFLTVGLLKWRILNSENSGWAVLACLCFFVIQKWCELIHLLDNAAQGWLTWRLPHAQRLFVLIRKSLLIRILIACLFDGSYPQFAAFATEKQSARAASRGSVSTSERWSLVGSADRGQNSRPYKIDVPVTSKFWKSMWWHDTICHRKSFIFRPTSSGAFNYVVLHDMSIPRRF